MRQVLVRIPIPGTGHEVTLYGYGVAMCLGFLAAILWAARRARRDGQPPEVIYNAALCCFFGGVFGARAFYFIQYSGEFPSLWDLVRIWKGGLTFYGGFLLATSAVIVYLKATRRPVLYWLDIIAPSLALGLAFGRVGCFLNGCCYGDICHHGWGMVWPEGSIPWEKFGDAPLHPTQIYSCLNALLLAVVLHVMFRYRRRNGQIILLFVVLYGISRFLLEVLRADESAEYLLGLPTLLRVLGMPARQEDLIANFGLTISQNIAIVMVIGGGLALVALARSRRPGLQVVNRDPDAATRGPLARKKRKKH